jgi:superfamily II DNA or RNA helicase
VIADTAKHYLNTYGRPVLVIAHRERLITQLAKTIEGWTGEPVAVEMAEQKAHDTLARITVASVPSLARESRRSRYHAERFGLVMVDEAHHSSAVGHLAILNHFPNAYKLGFTATPDRADQKALPFDKVLSEYRLTTAVKEGFLCPIEAELVPIRIDMTSVKVKMGDFQDKDIDAALTPYLERIADELVSRKEKHLVFLPLIKTSKLMAEILNRKGLKTAHLDGTSDNVDEVIRAYENGEYDCLTNALLFSEGVDIPCVSCVTNLRITKSRTTFSQIVGRGTRRHPSKERLLLLDFLWHTRRHKLCRPANLVAESEQVQELMERKYRNGGKMNVIQAHDQAEDMVARGHGSLVKEIQAHEHKKRELINPLHDGSLEGYRSGHRWEGEPATESQKKNLVRMGYNPEGMTQGQAYHILFKIPVDIQASPAQIWRLKQLKAWKPGLTKSEASSLLDSLIEPYKPQ